MPLDQHCVGLQSGQGGGSWQRHFILVSGASYTLIIANQKMEEIWVPDDDVSCNGYSLLWNLVLSNIRIGEFNSNDHYIHYCGQESLRRNGVALIVNKRVQNAVLGCNLKNDRMISVRFQGKPFNITVIQVYAWPVMLRKLKLNSSMKTVKTTRTSITNTQRRCPFHYRRLECKSRNSRNTWSNR